MDGQVRIVFAAAGAGVLEAVPEPVLARSRSTGEVVMAAAMLSRAGLTLADLAMSGADVLLSDRAMAAR